MTDEQKKIFINSVYEKLYKKPEYSQYVQDIKLAVLNEYIEFVKQMKMKINGTIIMQYSLLMRF